TTRSCVSWPTITTIASTPIADGPNRSPNPVAWAMKAMLTRLAENSVRKIEIRVSTSLWAVLRAASSPACSVASSWARTFDGAGVGVADDLAMRTVCSRIRAPSTTSRAAGAALSHRRHHELVHPHVRWAVEHELDG